MKARQWTVEQALSFMKSKRKEADPNPGFLQQLALFEAEGYQVRLPRPQVRRFLIQHTNAMDTLLTPTMLIQKGKDAGDDDPYSDPVDAASQTTSSSTSSARLRCKMCRRELASAEHVVPHDPGKGEMAFEPNKRDSVRKGVTPAPQAGMRALPQVPVLPPQLARARQALAGPTMRQSLLHSPRCSAYFVEPLTWMMDSSDVVEGVISGRLICPNDKCQAKLGSWTWAGTQCACGAWVTPAFGLQRAKVDEVFVS
ncbi:tyrosine protein phosphatase Yvh1 [Malassezia pachydermatis]